MIKFLIIVFLVVFVIPSVIFSIWAYFSDQKEAKNRKAPRPLTHAQMMALLEPDETLIHKPVQKIEKSSEKKRYEHGEDVLYRFE